MAYAPIVLRLLRRRSENNIAGEGVEWNTVLYAHAAVLLAVQSVLLQGDAHCCILRHVCTLYS